MPPIVTPFLCPPSPAAWRLTTRCLPHVQVRNTQAPVVSTVASGVTLPVPSRFELGAHPSAAAHPVRPSMATSQSSVTATTMPSTGAGGAGAGGGPGVGVGDAARLGRHASSNASGRTATSSLDTSGDVKSGSAAGRAPVGGATPVTRSAASGSAVTSTGPGAPGATGSGSMTTPRGETVGGPRGGYGGRSGASPSPNPSLNQSVTYPQGPDGPAMTRAVVPPHLESGSEPRSPEGPHGSEEGSDEEEEEEVEFEDEEGQSGGDSEGEGEVAGGRGRAGPASGARGAPAGAADRGLPAWATGVLDPASGGRQQQQRKEKEEEGSEEDEEEEGEEEEEEQEEEEEASQQPQPQQGESVEPDGPLPLFNLDIKLKVGRRVSGREWA